MASATLRASWLHNSSISPVSIGRRRSSHLGIILERGAARGRQTDRKRSNIAVLLADIAKRQQALMLKAPPHSPVDYALASAVVTQKLTFDVAQHGRG